MPHGGSSASLVLAPAGSTTRAWLLCSFPKNFCKGERKEWGSLNKHSSVPGAESKVMMKGERTPVLCKSPQQHLLKKLSSDSNFDLCCQPTFLKPFCFFLFILPLKKKKKKLLVTIFLSPCTGEAALSWLLQHFRTEQPPQTLINFLRYFICRRCIPLCRSTSFHQAPPRRGGGSGAFSDAQMESRSCLLRSRSFSLWCS